MAIVYRLQRSLLGASATTADSKSHFSYRSFAAFQQQPRQAKMLQNGVLQTYHSASLQGSVVCTGDRYGKLCHLGLGKVRLCCLGSNQPRSLAITSGRTPHSISGLVGRINCHQPQLRVGFSLVMPMNVFGYGSLDCRIRLSSSYPGASIKRSLSQTTKAIVNKNDDTGVMDRKRSGNARVCKMFNKPWMRVKSLSVYKRDVESGAQLGKNISRSKISGTKDTDAMNSRDHLIGDGKADVTIESSLSSSFVGNTNKVPSAEGKQKQQSRSKKSKEQSTASSASLNAGDHAIDRVSQAKKPRTNKRIPRSAVLELSRRI